MKWRYAAFLTIATAGLIPAVGRTQVDCVYRRIRVSRVQGAVFDRIGEPIPNVEVELKRDDKTIATTKTNQAGEFSIPIGPGTYELNAKAQGFYPGFAHLDVGSDLVRAFKPTHLWMIMDVGIQDKCPLTTTSRREFEEAIRNEKQKH